MQTKVSVLRRLVAVVGMLIVMATVNVIPLSVRSACNMELPKLPDSCGDPEPISGCRNVPLADCPVVPDCDVLKKQYRSQTTWECEDPGLTVPTHCDVNENIADC
ncbi:MAG: hypothetical protein ABII12_05365 [Planctomycetota bacterium]